MIQHHPTDELLLDHAAGQLAPGPALLIATHVALCAHCQKQVSRLETLGGALLETLAPADLAPEAWARTLARIDMPAAPTQPVRAAPPAQRLDLPAGMPWPHTLRACRVSPWRWLGPGMRWSRLTLPADPTANLVLLRIGAGRQMAAHTHTAEEFTQVLHGSFDDGRACFGPGDFDATDSEIHHQPTVQALGECICLAWTSGRLKYDGAVARLVGALVGI